MKRSYTSPETVNVLAPDSLSLIAMAKLYVGSSGFSYASWKPGGKQVGPERPAARHVDRPPVRTSGQDAPGGILGSV